MPTSAKQNEILQLQQSITKEVNTDAPAIAQGIFGDNKNHPDMAQVSNQQLDQLYIQKYQQGDRQWLQAEAQRDPNQFMDVAKRIGVTMPDPNAPPTPPPLNPAALAQNLMANAAGPAGPPPAAPVGLPGLPAAAAPPAALPAPLPAPAAGPVAPIAPPPVPAAPPPVILGPNGQPLPPSIPAMAGGGVVTQPTVALIGEAGPEAVVPLNGMAGPAATLQNGTASAPSPPADPDLAARLGSPAGPDVTPPTPSDADIRNYIAQAAKARGIDPNVALAVAQHEGTNPQTGKFDSPAQEGSFDTGHSFWPLQLHYGGPGYEQYGTTAGMGNDFTAQTGWQPGDPRAWQDATNYALDQALQYGWGRWYGSIPAKVAPTQGLPPSAPVVKGRSRGA